MFIDEDEKFTFLWTHRVEVVDMHVSVNEFVLGTIIQLTCYHWHPYGT